MNVLLNRAALRSQRRLLTATKRFYSAAAEPQIIVTDLPSPSSGRIRILSLNRPAARNAISRSLLADLRAQIDDVRSEYDAEGRELPPRKVMGGAGVDERGPTRVLIINSEVESCFCAGADLKERGGMSRDE
jgi:methylglutaconyl-CoA hydratase